MYQIHRFQEAPMSYSTQTHSRTHWLLWPVVALWRLLAGIITLTGRFVAMLIGVVFIFVGLLISLTIVGAILGIPLALFGLLLVVRGLA
jgi:hypothetical protein